MKRLRVGIIGGGHLGRIHARILKSNQATDLIGVADIDPRSRQTVQDELALPVVEDYRVFHDNIDAVIIATNTSAHYDIAIDCLMSGIHTFIEKPLTSTLQQADHLIHTADRRQTVLQVGHVERFNPAFELAASHLAKPRYVEAHRMSGYTFRSIDIGVVHDLMIHDIDLVASMVGSPLVEARAVGIAVFGPHEDIAQARLQFVDGTVANLTASRCSFRPMRTISWFSENGFVSADLTEGTVRKVAGAGELDSGFRDVSQLTPHQQERIKHSLFQDVLPLTELKAEPHNAIEMEQRDFFDAIERGRPPRVTGRHGRQALAIAEAIVESIKAHRWTDGFDTRTGRQAEKVHLLGQSLAEEARRAG